jgi:hypothetical protein
MGSVDGEPLMPVPIPEPAPAPAPAPALSERGDGCASAGVVARLLGFDLLRDAVGVDDLVSCAGLAEASQASTATQKSWKLHHIMSHHITSHHKQAIYFTPVIQVCVDVQAYAKRCSEGFPHTSRM